MIKLFKIINEDMEKGVKQIQKFKEELKNKYKKNVSLHTPFYQGIPSGRSRPHITEGSLENLNFETGEGITNKRTELKLEKILRKQNSLEDEGMSSLYGENSTNAYIKSTKNEIILDYTNERGRCKIEKGLKVGQTRVFLLKNEENDTMLTKEKRGVREIYTLICTQKT